MITVNRITSLFNSHHFKQPEAPAIRSNPEIPVPSHNLVGPGGYYPFSPVQIQPFQPHAKPVIAAVNSPPVPAETPPTDNDLIQAVATSDVSFAEYLLANGIKPNLRDPALQQPVIGRAIAQYDWPMIALLMRYGADLAWCEPDVAALSRALKLWQVLAPEPAEHYAKALFNREWSRCDREKVQAFINSVIHLKGPHAELDQPVRQFLSSDAAFAHPEQAFRHAAQLHSWKEPVQVGLKVLNPGWFPADEYLPRKIKCLLLALRDLRAGKVNTQSRFEESRQTVEQKLSELLQAQATAYMSQRHLALIGGLSSPLRETLIAHEAQHLRHQVNVLQPGDHFLMTLGTEILPHHVTHAFYLGFQKMPDHTVRKTTYDMGFPSAFDMVRTPEGKLFPQVIANIPAQVFSDPRQSGAGYFRSVLHNFLTKTDPWVACEWLNRKAELLDPKARLISEPTTALSMKKQMAPNCVVKNNTAATRDILANRRLSQFVKQNEISYAGKVARLKPSLVAQMEAQREAVSLAYIVHKFESTQNAAVALDQLLRFFSKRMNPAPGNWEPARQLNKLLAQADKNPRYHKWLIQDSVQKMLSAVNNQ